MLPKALIFIYLLGCDSEKTPGLEIQVGTERTEKLNKKKMQTEITVCQIMSRNDFWKHETLASKTIRWWHSECRWSNRTVLVHRRGEKRFKSSIMGMEEDGSKSLC